MAVEKDTNQNGSASITPEVAFPMAKRDGEGSYSKNSQFQAIFTKLLMLDLDETLEKMILPSNGGTVCVADMGSSSGPNTIMIVAHIVDKLRHRLPKGAEFQAFFNDLPSNDFNNLFQLLSNDSRAKNFYAAGAPGSFLGRLFPQSSIQVFYSANSLHWMSKMPDVVQDRRSPSYNKGEVWYESRPAVAKSYQQQALLELTSFLEARAAELVSGGLLFFFMSGRETSEPDEVEFDLVHSFLSDLNEIFSGLVGEGLLSEQQYDDFNLPFYCRSCEDVREAVKNSGSLFSVAILKVHTTDMSEAIATDPAKKLTSFFKAILNPRLEALFGNNVAEVIWERYEKSAEKKIGLRPDIFRHCVAGLIRN